MKTQPANEMTKQVESLRAEAANKRKLAKLAEQNSDWHLASAYTQQAEDRERAAFQLEIAWKALTRFPDLQSCTDMPTQNFTPMKFRSLDSFTRSYIETALWSSMDDEGEPLDGLYSADDLAPEALAQMAKDCTDFQENNAQLLEIVSELCDSTRAAYAATAATEHKLAMQDALTFLK